MKQLISFNRAISWCLLIFGLTLLFHAAIIAGIVFFDYTPIDFLWGGRMETKQELLVFEFVSLFVTLVCIVTVMVKSGKIAAPRLKRASGIVLWLLFVLFLVNTIGNIFAKTTFEQLFSIVTIVLAVLCLRLAIEK